MQSFSPRVLSAFEIIPQQASVRDFHGPWNKLLNYVFPPDSPYAVIPREYYPVIATKEQSGLKEIETENQPQLWFMKFEIQFEGLPVLLVLVSAPAVVESPLARKLADAETRKQMSELLGPSSVLIRRRTMCSDCSMLMTSATLRTLPATDHARRQCFWPPSLPVLVRHDSITHGLDQPSLHRQRR